MPAVGKRQATCGYPQVELLKYGIKNIKNNMKKHIYDKLHELMKGFVSFGIQRRWKHCKWA